MTGGDYIANIENGSSNIALWDYCGNLVSSYSDPEGRGMCSPTPIGPTSIMFYKPTSDWT